MTSTTGAVLTGSGGHTYRWIEDWAREMPRPDAAAVGWAHPGMALTPDDLIATCHPGLPLILFFRPDGSLARSFQLDITEAHGIAAHHGSLWVADNGAKRQPGPGYPAHTAPDGGQVLEVGLDGAVRRRYATPGHAAYATGKFSPTSMAVTDDGEVWIADGYGQSLVHRYRGDRLLQTLSGEEGEAGAFKTPHAVWVDRRAGKREPELYVADRTNARIQVYDLDGRYKRCLGPEADRGTLITPTAFAATDDLLVVAEFRGARITLLDVDDRVVAFLGANTEVVQLDGWPNRKDASGEPIRPPDITPGRFNGPHGVAADATGAIYAAEWVIGGRYVKLVPA